MRWIFAAVALALCTPASVNAQEEADNGQEDWPDRFRLNVGTFHVYDRDSEVSAESGAGIIGATIDFERDLGAGEDDSSGRLKGYYRFNPHHRLDFGWYKVERDGSRTIDRELSFGDATFPVNGGVKSSLDTEVATLGYTWSFYHEEKAELGISLGAYWMSYDIELSNFDRTIVEKKSVSSPLPVFGVHMDYTINPRWHALFDYESFYIEWDDKIRGSLDDLQLSLEYRPLRNISFGVAANRLAADVEIDESDYRGSVADLMRGGQFYIGLHF